MAAPGPYKINHKRSSLSDTLRRLYREWSRPREQAKLMRAAEASVDRERGPGTPLVEAGGGVSAGRGVSAGSLERRLHAHEDPRTRRHSESAASTKGRPGDGGARSARRPVSSGGFVPETPPLSREGSDLRAADPPDVQAYYRILKAYNKKPQRRHSTGSRKSERSKPVLSAVCTSPGCACHITREYTSRILREDQERARVARTRSAGATDLRQTSRPTHQRTQSSGATELRTQSGRATELRQPSHSTSQHGQQAQQECSSPADPGGHERNTRDRGAKHDHMQDIDRQNSENSIKELRESLVNTNGNTTHPVKCPSTGGETSPEVSFTIGSPQAQGEPSGSPHQTQGSLTCARTAQELRQDDTHTEERVSCGANNGPVQNSPTNNLPANPNMASAGDSASLHYHGARPKSVKARPKPPRPEGGCTSPICACSVVRDFTHKMMLQDRQTKAAERQSGQGGRQDISPDTSQTAAPEGATQPQTPGATRQGSAPRTPKEEGSTSPSCACASVKIYTENVLNHDRRIKENREKLAKVDNVGRQAENAQTRATQEQADRAPPRDIPRHRSSQAGRPPRQPLLYDKNTIRYLARQYNLKKQPHKCKKVVVKRGPYHERTERVKYKSLVEIYDSLPDLLQAALEDKERRREERKDQAKQRNKRIKKAVEEVLLSSNDYALRRRAKVPYYSSYPRGRNPPPIPALMAKLPNPPVYFREATV